jgi:hypothetical protein
MFLGAALTNINMLMGKLRKIQILEMFVVIQFEDCCYQLVCSSKQQFCPQLLGFWILAIIRYFKEYCYGNWICFSLQGNRSSFQNMFFIIPHGG